MIADIALPASATTTTTPCSTPAVATAPGTGCRSGPWSDLGHGWGLVVNNYAADATWNNWQGFLLEPLGLGTYVTEGEGAPYWGRHLRLRQSGVLFALVVSFLVTYAARRRRWPARRAGVTTPANPAAYRPVDDDEWLVIIDPQAIFASPSSVGVAAWADVGRVSALRRPSPRTDRRDPLCRRSGARWSWGRTTTSGGCARPRRRPLVCRGACPALGRRARGDRRDLREVECRPAQDRRCATADGLGRGVDRLLRDRHCAPRPPMREPACGSICSVRRVDRGEWRAGARVMELFRPPSPVVR